MLFLVGAGELPEAQMRAVTIALSRYWNNEFRKISCEQSPNEEISLLNQKDGLFQLEGDAASANHEGGCWLESLGTWKIPTILMVLSSSDGSVPGIASAYVALCKSLSVPLIGIVQLGGYWDRKRRSLDGLPWCGKLSIHLSENQFSSFDESSQLIEIEDIVSNIRKKMIDLNL